MGTSDSDACLKSEQSFRAISQGNMRQKRRGAGWFPARMRSATIGSRVATISPNDGTVHRVQAEVQRCSQRSVPNITGNSGAIIRFITLSASWIVRRAVKKVRISLGCSLTITTFWSVERPCTPVARSRDGPENVANSEREDLA
jgi:hypothetical protein